MQEANQSAVASDPSSTAAEDRPPGTLDPNQRVPPIAVPSPTATGTPEPIIKGTDRADKERQAPVGETDNGNKNCGDTDKPANIEETDEKQPVA